MLINAGATAAFALALVSILTAPLAWSFRHGVVGGPSLAAILALIATLSLRAASDFAQARLTARHASRVKTLVRRRVMATLLGRARGDSAVIGEAVGAAAEEIEALDGYYSLYVPAALEARLGPVAILVAVALASPISAGILLATLVPFAAVMALAGGAAGAAARGQVAALSRLSGTFVDRLRALPVILAFQAEGAETAQVATAAREVSARTLNVLRIAFISSGTIDFFAALAVALVAVYCGFSLLGLLPFKVPESLDFRHAFVALALAPEVYGPLRRLSAAYHEKSLGEAAMARLRPLLEPQAAAASTDLPAESPPPVRLKGLTLKLGDMTLGPLNAVAPAGALTVITGPTGSGKSSLLAAILGASAPQAGGVEIADIGVRGALTGAVATAGQAPVFLPGTILENLLWASPSVTSQDALDMAIRLGLGPALAARALGAATVLDERGSGLSGGERRRLVLARAFLKPARLILLDEPTADLDGEAKAAVVALILSLTGTHTIIAATHDADLAAVAANLVSLA
jgi:ATP-binding cassette subfamily C protein CydD